MTIAAKFRSIFVVLCAVFTVLNAGRSVSAQERPLLVEDRQTVFQRVLTRPGAELRSSPDAPVVEIFPAFQPLYVFERRTGWVRVGPSISAPARGWIAAGQVVDWRQNIVAAFTNPANRKRAILFESEAALRSLMENEARQALQDKIISDAEANTLNPRDQVVAVEPSEHIDITQRFYLLPILDYVQHYHPDNYLPNTHLQVASIPLRDEDAPSASAGDFDTGIVFVFDTTRSMDPFIASSQIAIESIVRQIQGTEIGDRVNFGVVAFRDNVDAVPGLEYRTKILTPLARRADQTEVIATIRAATEVTGVNSPGFNEDSLAGVEDAINLIDWDGGGVDAFDAKVIILVTDAGPKGPGDPNARSNIGVDQLRQQAELNNVTLMALHLRTPSASSAQHAYAEDQYKRLTARNGTDYYYGIPNGSADVLQSEVSRIVTVLTDIVRSARGEAPVLNEAEAGPEMVQLARAIELEYLGDLEGTQAPSIIAGWVSEKAPENEQRLAVQPHLLVTRNEMATMYDLLDELLALYGSGTTTQDSASFFDQVQNIVARMARNPDRLLDTEVTSLGSALEFLEDLPYESPMLQMTQERWGQSAMSRRITVDTMRQKHTQYGKWLRDTSIWIALFEDAPDGEYVFAMPFDALP
ncbi:MAG: vWA domain-containing protein [Pseudomonadota bacterium]